LRVLAEVVQIRTAHPEETSEIVSLLRQSFAEFEDLYTPEAFDATVLDPARVRERMTDGRMFVAVLGAKIVGTVTIFQVGADILYVRGMAVLPSARGNRVGQLLLERIESLALENGNKRLQLRTTPFLTAAIRLYERFGFCRDDRSMDLFGTLLIGMTKELKDQKSEVIEGKEYPCRKTTDTTPLASA
jgi:GNAT superfamily N-acetyltransferase